MTVVCVPPTSTYAVNSSFILMIFIYTVLNTDKVCHPFFLTNTRTSMYLAFYIIKVSAIHVKLGRALHAAIYLILPTERERECVLCVLPTECMSCVYYDPKKTISFHAEQVVHCTIIYVEIRWHQTYLCQPSVASALSCMMTHVCCRVCTPFAASAWRRSCTSNVKRTPSSVPWTPVLDHLLSLREVSVLCQRIYEESMKRKSLTT